MKRILPLFLSFLVFTIAAFSQDSAHVFFHYSQKRINDKQVQLMITAGPAQTGITLYPIKKSDADLVYSTVTFDSIAAKLLADSVKQLGTLTTETDTTLGASVSVVKDSVQWVQTINLGAADSVIVKGVIAYMYKKGGEYPSGSEDFRFVIMPEKKDAAVSPTAPNNKNSSLLLFFLAAFGGGLFALLTPCIYSMIPVTVSFFTKRSKTRREGIRNALYYSISIILIFTLIGTGISAIFGADALQKVSTHWIANLFFFTLFVLFGISFLGAFEIELPSSWANRADSKASTKDFKGIFFMALTLVIVSFSCTSPIIGLIVVESTKGAILKPMIGFLGFSLALALPFAFFAFFPSKLNALGKAGGWLNAIKVTLGFLELALALKFLSNADLDRKWRILDREVFLVLWIVIFLLLGLYLLGKLKFKHDDELPKNDFGLPYLTVTRLLFAIASFSIAVYMTPGLWGAPLNGLSAFVPPMGTQDFNADDLPQGFNLDKISSKNTMNQSSNDSSGNLPHPVKYYAALKQYEPNVAVNNGLITYFDYKEALAIARKLKKPLMIDFTGIQCINCRKMEGAVWSDPEVMNRLKNDFIVVSLYVDSKEDIPISEQYFSKSLNKQVETLGEMNTDLQVSRFGTNSQPYYFYLDANEQRLVPDGYGYDPDIKKFIAHLDKAIAEYKKRAGN